jgi:hypothetical protein
VPVSPRDDDSTILANQSPKSSASLSPSNSSANLNHNTNTNAPLQTRTRSDKSTPTDFSKVVVTDPQLHVSKETRTELTTSSPSLSSQPQQQQASLPSPRVDGEKSEKDKKKTDRKESKFSFGNVLKKTIAPMICIQNFFFPSFFPDFPPSVLILSECTEAEEIHVDGDLRGDARVSRAGAHRTGDSRH